VLFQQFGIRGYIVWHQSPDANEGSSLSGSNENPTP
jgi:hypothetical protein